MQGKLRGIQLVSLVGRQGAGKSTLGTILAKKLDCAHIEVSSIVRSITGAYTPFELIKTSEDTKTRPTWLGDAIADSISSDTKRVVLTGVRELEVHETLVNKYEAKLSAVVIYCPQNKRLDRQLKSGKCLDIRDFLSRDLNEAEMGMEALFPLYPSVLCTDYTKPTRVVDQIIELLESTGAV